MVFNSVDGWIHRAKPLEKFHVALKINADYATIPAKFQTFTYHPAEYSHIQILDENENPLPDGTAIPTMVGPNTDYRIQIKTPDTIPGTYYTIQFHAPPGFKNELDSLLQGFDPGVPGVNLQLNIGLPLKTEVAIRYFPKMDIKGISPDILGIGVKHDLGQYLDLDDAFRWSGYAAFAHSDIRAKRDSIDWETRYRLNTLTVGTVASIELSIISIYGGVAYVHGGTLLQVLGNKDITYDIVDNNNVILGQYTETLHNPLDLRTYVDTYKGFAGIQLNLLILHIFAQYNLQKYPGYHAGISIQF